MLFTIFIWIDDATNRRVARTEYRKNLIKVFEEGGVKFALPIRMVTMNH